jgi:Zn-dependent M28 family amino/carboxypeptidase
LRARVLIVLAVAAGVAPLARAQTSPFVPEPVFHHLANEISGDRAFEDVRHLTQFHRTDGSRDFFAAAEWIRDAAVAAGLEDVELIRQKWEGHGWSCSFGEAWLVEPEERKLAAYSNVAVSIADQSRTTHVRAALVDVGRGLSEADYAGKDVRGKIVLADGPLASVHAEAVWRRGALGILSDTTNETNPLDTPDQVAWGRLPYDARNVAGVPDGTPATFGVMISPRRGQALRARIQANAKPLEVKVDIDAAYPEESEQALVEGWIRGSQVHDEQIALTAHLQEEKTSANDNGSGCASLLEIGRSLARLVKEGKLPRPRRDIRFWWTNEMASERQYFRENPTEPRKMLLNVTSDMVGARQSWGGRVQYAARSPWSLPSALDDVMESVLDMVRDGNTEVLSLLRTKAERPFTREITAVRGSREPFHAAMVPYFGLSDHDVFTRAQVGVPSTALINWPDPYIHSTGDDLANVDATQLQRNAFVVAAVALFFGGAGDEELATLGAYSGARARARISLDVSTAVARVAEAGPAERDKTYRLARNLIHQSHAKEAAALSWVRRLPARNGRAAEVASRAASLADDGEGDDLSALERAYVGLTGKNPPNPEISREEKNMAMQVYLPVAEPAFGDAIRKVRHVEGLHPAMQAEVFNFADGKRSALDVYDAVSSEALSAGAWYYGTVSSADVEEALERAARAGAFTLRGSR